MAIKQRVTAEFDLIFVYDDALNDLPTVMVQEWIAKGRNIEDLNLKQCTEQPSIFRCRPLLTKFEYLKDRVKEGDPLSCWAIFAVHVVGAKNCSDERGRDLLTWDDSADRTIKDNCRDNIPSDVVVDIARVICGKSEEASAVFTVPDSFWATRARSQMLRAKDATSKSDAETSPE
jgi:hypothetical protein